MIQIVMFCGDTALFSCSGIAIDRQGHLTRFLTSASLVTALYDIRNKNHLIDIEVGADNHPLLICLLSIIMCSSLALSLCRLKCVLKEI